MYRKFVQFIEKNELFKQNEKLVVGVSGGADSVCLLSLLCKLREEMPFEMTVVHINHGIRKEAKEDALFVENLCAKYGVPFILEEHLVNELAKEWNMSSEEAGRKVRYDAFLKALGDEGGKIVVAHNQNDVAETVLFHLFRGSSSTGLTGIRAKNGNIVRPLLCFTREEIEKYLEENHLNYCIDKTNLTDDYTRNKIRNHILPYVEEHIVTGSVGHIYQTAGHLSEQEDYLKQEAACVLKRVAEFDENAFVCRINRIKFSKLHIFMKKKVLYIIIEQLSGSKKDITAKHIQNVLDLFEKTGMKKISLPYNLQAKSGYEYICVERKPEKQVKELYESALEEAKGFTFQVFSDKMPDTVPEMEYTKWFDYDKIEKSLVIRTRKEGDYFMVQGGTHKKSLGRYFIDEKVPKDERDQVLLLADGSHIVWIIGMRISDYYKITENTKTIIKIQYEGEYQNGKTSH